MAKDTLKKAKDDLEGLAKKADEFNAMLGKPTRAECEEAYGAGNRACTEIPAAR